jgi:hypothetical protein
VSDVPPGAFPPDSGQHSGPPPPAASTVSAFGRPARWPTFIVLAIALVGMAVAFVGWFRPVPHNNQPPPKPTYSEQQIADAKAKVCAAFAKVDHALDISGARNSGGDPAMQLAVAASGRQVLDAGSRYLLTKLAEEPATPPDLAIAVRQQADSFQELMIGYLDELANSAPEQQPTLKASDEATLTIRRLCK